MYIWESYLRPHIYSNSCVRQSKHTADIPNILPASKLNNWQSFWEFTVSNLTQLCQENIDFIPELVRYLLCFCSNNDLHIWGTHFSDRSLGLINNERFAVAWCLSLVNRPLPMLYYQCCARLARIWKLFLIFRSNCSYMPGWTPSLANLIAVIKAHMFYVLSCPFVISGVHWLLSTYERWLLTLVYHLRLLRITNVPIN